VLDAQLERFKEGEFYQGLTVRDLEGTMQPIMQAISDVRGKLLLIGESGLAKSTYLRFLASQSSLTIAYLNARSCEKRVESTIVDRVSGFQSLEFFKGLMYTGDLVVVIDGLNEVSAAVRLQIINFANSAAGANFLIATQPIDGIAADRSPFKRATPYELMPLGHEDIAKFLKSRPARNKPTSKVRGQDYDRNVDRLLANALRKVPATGARRQAEAVLGEVSSAELILSNPMDLTYAGELIAMGQTPRPSQLIQQAFNLACERYHATYKRDFPVLDLARKVVSLRKEDRNWLNGDEFPNEQGVLGEFRLAVPQLISETTEKQVSVMRFRHERVTDVLTKPAFEIDGDLQIQLIDDPRFRGVYLLFAQAADRERAQQIRDLLVNRAAETRDHGLVDEYVRLSNRRPLEENYADVSFVE
jgi:hypothetical protein